MSAPARRMPVSVSSATASQVDPAVGRGGADHRVLPRHLVGGNGHRRDVGGGAHHVEVGHRRLDHHDVGALGDVEFDLAQRLARVAGVLLVGAPVTLQARRDGLAERTVERRRELRGVGEDARCRCGRRRRGRRGSRRPGRPSCRWGRPRVRPNPPAPQPVSTYRALVASLSTRPRASSTPQWPWSVNSSRQVSAISDGGVAEVLGADPAAPR